MIIPFYRWENLGTESLSNMPKLTVRKTILWIWISAFPLLPFSLEKQSLSDVPLLTGLGGRLMRTGRKSYFCLFFVSFFFFSVCVVSKGNPSEEIMLIIMFWGSEEKGEERWEQGRFTQPGKWEKNVGSPGKKNIPGCSSPREVLSHSQHGGLSLFFFFFSTCFCYLSLKTIKYYCYKIKQIHHHIKHDELKDPIGQLRSFKCIGYTHKIQLWFFVCLFLSFQVHTRGLW